MTVVRRSQSGRRGKIKPSQRHKGQAIVESVIAFMVILLIFFTLTQLMLLASAQFIADHSAFVAGRSHVVGFDHDVVQRAKEVGSIGLAGHVTNPPALEGLSMLELGAIEPVLIGEFIQESGYILRYEHWHLVDLTLPANEDEIVETFQVNVRNYPVDLPMSDAFMGDTIDLRGSAKLFNHAALYLE